MEIAAIPATAKLSHIRTVLQEFRMKAKGESYQNASKAIVYLSEIERELRK